MRCFYHTDREAVGTCRACSKGLCPECAVDLDVALGCKGRHEGAARRLALSQARASRLASILPVFLIGLGAVWGAWGLLSRPLSIFMIITGVGFAVFGLLFLKRDAASTK
jgi:hypothetical protein